MMKNIYTLKTLLTVFIVSSLPFFIQAQDDPIHYLPMDNIALANDESGNGNNGVITGASLQLDNCNGSTTHHYYNFDGNDEIRFNHLPLTTGDFTFSFWLKIDPTITQQTAIMSQRNVCNVGNFVDIRYTPTEKRLSFEVRGTNTNGNEGVANYWDYTPTGEWDYFTMIKGSGKSVIYINGRQVLSADWTNPSLPLDVTNTADFIIGKSPCDGVGGQTPLKGGIDDVRVYDRMLTDAEIQVLYASLKKQQINWTRLMSLNVNGNSLERLANSGTGYNNSGASSVQILGRDKSGFIQLSESDGHFADYIVGFSTEDARNYYGSFPFAIRQTASGSMYAMEGTSLTLIGTANTGDDFRLDMSRVGDGGDGKVRIYQNGVVKWTRDLSGDIASAPLIIEVNVNQSGTETDLITASFCEGFVASAEHTSPASCGGNGSITVATNYGEAPYSFRWLGGNLPDNGYEVNASSKSDLPNGQYDIWVKDAKGLERLIHSTVGYQLQWTNLSNATISGNEVFHGGGASRYGGVSSVDVLGKNTSGYIDISFDAIRQHDYGVGFIREDIEASLTSMEYWVRYLNGHLTFRTPSESYYYGTVAEGDFCRLEMSRVGDGGDGKMHAYINGEEVWSANLEGEYTTEDLITDVYIDNNGTAAQTNVISASFCDVPACSGDIQWTNFMRATATGNTLTSQHTKTEWRHSGASSVDILKRDESGYVELQIDQARTVNYALGFTTEDIDTRVSTVGLYLTHSTANEVKVVLDGNETSLGTASEGEKYRLDLSRVGDGGDGIARVYKDGAEVWSGALTGEYISLPLFADVSIGTPGGETHPIVASFCGGLINDLTITTATSCSANGAISITSDLGEAPYSYKWSGPNVNDADYTVGTSSKSNLEVGEYIIWVRDAAGKERFVRAFLNHKVEWTGFVNAATDNNKLTNTGVASYGHSGASSVNILGRGESGYIDLSIDEVRAADYFIGFATEDIDADNDLMGYALQHRVDGEIWVHYEGVFSPLQSNKKGDVFRLELSRTGDGGDGKVYVYRNGVELWSRDLIGDYIDAPLIMDAALTTNAGGESHLISTSFCNGFIANVTTTGITSCKASDGTATIIPSLGTAPYSYKWSGPTENDADYVEGAASKTNLAVGQYNIWVKDATGKERLKHAFIGYNPQWTNLINTSVSDNKLTHTETAGGWGNSGASTIEQLGSRESGYIELEIDALRPLSYMVGFSKGDVDAHHTSMSYRFYYVPNGRLQVWYGNSNAVNVGTVKVGDIFRLDISRDGDGGDNKVRVFRNGIEVWSKDLVGDEITDVLNGDIALGTAGQESHPITVSFCVSDLCSPTWVRQGNLTVEPDGTLSRTQNSPAGASSLGILKEGEDGELILTISQEDLLSEYYIGLSERDQVHSRINDLLLALHYDKGTVGFRNPSTGNEIDVTASVNDRFRVVREGGTINYYHNETLISSYPNYNGNYVADLYLVSGESQQIEVSFCEGFDIKGTVTNTTCGNSDGSIALRISADGINYTADPNYNYTWTKDGADFLECTEGTCNGLSPGLYEVTVEDDKGRKRINGFYVGYTIDWFENQYLEFNSDGTISKKANLVSDAVGTHSLGLLPAGQDGSIIYRIIREDNTSQVVLGWSSKDAIVSSRDIGAGISIANGAAVFTYPNGGRLPVGYVKIGDEFRVTRTNGTLSYHINDRQIVTQTDTNEAYVLNLSINIGQTQQIGASFCTGFDIKGTVTNSSCESATGAISLEVSTDGQTYVPLTSGGDYTIDWQLDGEPYAACSDGNCLSLPVGVYDITVANGMGQTERLTFTIGENTTWESATGVTNNGDGSLTRTAVSGRVQTVGDILDAGNDGHLTLRIDQEDLTSTYYVGFTSATEVTNESDIDFSIYYNKGTVRFRGQIVASTGYARLGDEYSLRRVGNTMYAYVNGFEVASLGDVIGEYRAGVEIASGRMHPVTVGLCPPFCEPTWVRKISVTDNGDGTFTAPVGEGDGGASSVNILGANQDGEIKITIDQTTISGRYYIGLSEKDNISQVQDIKIGIRYINGEVRFKNPSNNNYGFIQNVNVGDVVSIKREAGTIKYAINDALVVEYPNYDETYILDLTIIDGKTHPVTVDFCKGFVVKGNVTDASCGVNDGSIALEISTDGENYSPAPTDGSYTYSWTRNGNGFPECTDGTCNDLPAGDYEVTVTDVDNQFVRVQSFNLASPVVWINQSMQMTDNGDGTFTNTATQGSVGASSLGILNSGEDGTVILRVTQEDFDSDYLVGLSARDNSRLANDFTFSIRYSKGRVRFQNPTGAYAGINGIHVGDELIIKRVGGTVSYYVNDHLSASYENYDDSYVVDFYGGGTTQPVSATFCTGFDVKNTVVHTSCGNTDGEIALRISTDGTTYTADNSYSYTWSKDGQPYTNCTTGTCSNLGVGTYEVIVSKNNQSRKVVVEVNGDSPTWINTGMTVNADGSLTSNSAGWSGANSEEVLEEDGSFTLRIDRIDENSRYYVGLSQENTGNVTSDFETYLLFLEGRMIFKIPGGNTVELGHASIGDEYTVSRTNGDIKLYINGWEHSSYSGYDNTYVLDVLTTTANAQTHPIAFNFCLGECSPNWVELSKGIEVNAEGYLSHTGVYLTTMAFANDILKEGADGEFILDLTQDDAISTYYVGLGRPDHTRKFDFQIYSLRGFIYLWNPDTQAYLAIGGSASGKKIHIRRENGSVAYFVDEEERYRFDGYNGDYAVKGYTLVGQTSPITIDFCGGFMVKGSVSPATCGSNDGSIALEISGNGVDYNPAPTNGSYNYTWTKDGSPFAACNTGNCTDLEAGVYEVQVTDNSGRSRFESFVVGSSMAWVLPNGLTDNGDGTITRSNTVGDWTTNSIGILKANEDGELTIRIDRDELTSRYYVGLSEQGDVNYDHELDFYIYIDRDQATFKDATRLGYLRVGDELSIRRVGDRIAYYVNGVEWAGFEGHANKNYVANVVMTSLDRTHEISASFCEGFDVNADVVDSYCGANNGAIELSVSTNGVDYTNIDNSYTVTWTKDGEVFNGCDLGMCEDVGPGVYIATITGANGHVRTETYKISSPVTWLEATQALTVNTDGTLTQTGIYRDAWASSIGILGEGQDGEMTLHIDRDDDQSLYYIGLSKSDDSRTHDFYIYYIRGVVFVGTPEGNNRWGGREITIKRVGGTVTFWVDGIERTSYENKNDAYVVKARIPIGQTHRVTMSFCEGFGIRSNVTDAGCSTNTGSIQLDLTTDGTTYNTADDSYTYVWTKDGQSFNCTTGNCANLYAGVYEVKVTDAAGRSRKKSIIVGDTQPEWTDILNLTSNADGTLTRTSGTGSGAFSTKAIPEGEDGAVSVRIDREDLATRYYVGLAKANTTNDQTEMDFYIYYDNGVVSFKDPTQTNPTLLSYAKIGDEYSIRRQNGKVVYYVNGGEFSSFDGYNEEYFADVVVIGVDQKTHPISTSVCPAVTECGVTWVRLGNVTVDTEGKVSKIDPNNNRTGAASLNILGEGEDGELSFVVTEQDIDTEYFVGLSERDDSHRLEDMPFYIGYQNNRVRFKNPAGGRKGYDVQVGDKVSIRRTNGRVAYYINDVEQRAYDGYNNAYVIDLSLDGDFGPIVTTDFCNGFDIQATVTDATCATNDGRIVLSISTDGQSYDSAPSTHEYSWTRNGAAYPDCSTGDCQSLPTGVYEVTVSHGSLSRRKVITVGTPITWINPSNDAATSLGILAANEDGEFTIRMTDFTEAFRVGLQEKGSNFAFSIQYRTNRTIRFQRPEGGWIGGINPTNGDEYTIRRRGDEMIYFINGLELARYSGVRNNSYKAALTGVLNNTVAASFCEGFDIRGTVSNASCGEANGRIALEMTTDGTNYVTAPITGFTYTWTKDGQPYTLCDVGDCSTFETGVYEVEVRSSKGISLKKEFIVGSTIDWIKSSSGLTNNGDGTFAKNNNTRAVGASSLGILGAGEDGEVTLRITEEGLANFFIGLASADRTLIHQEMEFAIRFRDNQIRFIDPTTGNNTSGWRDVSIGDYVSIRRRGNNIAYYHNNEEVASFEGYGDSYVADLSIRRGQTLPIDASFCQGFDVSAAITNVDCEAATGHISLSIAANGENYDPANTLSGYSYSWLKDGISFNECDNGNCQNLAIGVYQVTVKQDATNKSQIRTYVIGGKPTWTNADDVTINSDGSLTTQGGRRGASSAERLAASTNGFISLKIDRLDAISRYDVGFSKEDLTNQTSDMDFYITYNRGNIRLRGLGGVNVNISEARLGDEIVLQREGSRILFLINSWEHSSYDGYSDEYLADVVIRRGTTHPIHVSFTDVIPTLSITSSDFKLCGTESATLSVENYSLQAGEQIAWYKDGVEVSIGTSLQYIVDHQSEGTYTVRLVRDGGCEGSLSNEIIITQDPIPVPVVTLLTANEICAGEVATVKLAVTNRAEISGALDYTYFANGELLSGSLAEGVSEVEIFSGILNTTASFELISLGQSGEDVCAATDLGNIITVIVKPANSVTLEVLNNQVCAGEEVQLKLDFINSGPYEIQYTLGGEVKTERDLYDGDVLLIPTTTTGINTLTVTSITAESQGGCSSSSAASVTFEVLPLPTALFTDDGPISICNGDVVSLEFSLTGQENYELVYSDGDGEYTAIIGNEDGNVGSETYIVALDGEVATDKPAKPLVSTTYQIVSVKDATGCVNTNISDHVSVSVNGMPSGYLFANTTEYCGQETIMLSFEKTYPQNNDPVTIKYTDGIDIFTYVSPAPTVFVDELPAPFEFPAYPSATDPRAEVNVPYFPITTFRLISIETVKRADDGSVAQDTQGQDVLLKTQGLNSNVPVTVNKQPEATIAGPSVVCFEDEVKLTFRFTKGEAPFSVKVKESVSGEVYEFFRLENGETRTFYPTASLTYQLVEVIDANNCAWGDGSTTILDQIAITVNERPVAILSGVPNSAICQGTEFTLVASAENKGLAPYQMQYTDGTTIFEATLNSSSSTSTQVVSPTQTTTFEVLNIRDANGCSSLENELPVQELIVNQRPVISLTVNRDCVGNSSSILFNATAGIPPFSIEYQKNGNTPSTMVFNGTSGVLATETGTDVTYKITQVTDGAGCEMDLITSPLEQVVNGLDVRLEAVQPELCFGDKIMLKVVVAEGCTPFEIKFTNGTTEIPKTVEDGTIIELEPSLTDVTFTITEVAGNAYTDNHPVTITVGNAPNAPTGLTATLVTQGIADYIQLNWADLADEEGYIVSRKLDSETTYSQLTSLGQDVTNYVDHTAKAGLTYNYVVQGVSGTCASANSNEVVGTIYQLTFISPLVGDEFCKDNPNTLMWKGQFQNDASLLTITWHRVDEHGNETATGLVEDNIAGSTNFIDWNFASLEDGTYFLTITNESSESSKSNRFNIVSDCIEPAGNDQKWYHAELHPKLDEQFHVSNGVNLRFRLEEKYVNHQSASIKIFDWAHREVKGFEGNKRLMKYYGHNFYSLDLEYLSTLASGSEPRIKDGDMYVMEVTDGVNNETKYLRFKYEKAPTLALDIKVEVGFSAGGNICDGSATPSLNFIPILKENGTERYQVEWYYSTTNDFETATNITPANFKKWMTRAEVEGNGSGALNNDPTSVSNGSSSAALEMLAELSGISYRFDQAPYYIYLKVKDNCGNEKVAWVEVKCENNSVSNGSGINITIVDVNNNGE